MGWGQPRDFLPECRAEIAVIDLHRFSSPTASRLRDFSVESEGTLSY